MFPTSTQVPEDETAGTFFVGNAISPGQAGLMLYYLEKALARQQNHHVQVDLKALILDIRAAAGTCRGKQVVQTDDGCVTLREADETNPDTAARSSLPAVPCTATGHGMFYNATSLPVKTARQIRAELNMAAW